ncbi:MAG TPA: UvrD-helicase domain-containing protein [Steroidobacteraceae bacterium]|nr:UvrD-helicase domain-containing protein [Steroidobacteraceae bacterium]
MSEQDAATIDSLARSRALDPEQSFIVQAPAGSGKTELLTQRYLRLLTTVEHPEQVLAITFTRKAAAEMRARIVKALESASSDAIPIVAHARLTWTLARAVRDVDAARGWNLTQHPSRLRIQTIDALTGLLARRLPILSGIGASFEPLDDARPLYETACERLLERLGDGSPVAHHLETLIVHLGHRVDALLGLLRDLLSRRDQWLHSVVHARNSRDLRATVERVLQAVIQHHLEALCDALAVERRRELWELTRYGARNLLENALNGERRALLEACLQRDEPPGPDSECFRAWQAIADVFLKQDGQFYRQVTKKQGFPTTNAAVKARMERMLEEIAEDVTLCSQLGMLRTLPGTTYADEQWHMLEALFEVLPVAVAELQLVFQQQGRADHVESSLRALRALGSAEEPTDLALALDYQLRHILVDEFQDTSFTQLDLLERLTAGWMPNDGRTLFCVGDPMQSIYRFRQAEVGLFLELQQGGLKHLPLEPLMLSANFRSHPAVVEWVNRVFPQVFPPRDELEEGAVKYSASVAARTEEGGGVHMHARIQASALATAGAVVDIVREALSSDDRGTIAILVAARTHVGFIAEQLQRAGIEHQAVEIQPLANRPVVQDLIALTRALVHLADRTAWVAVLRAPWCGLTLADLHVIAADRGAATVRELLQQAVQDEGVPISSEGRTRATRTFTVLEQALHERSRASLRDWVERTWNALGGPATRREEQDLEDAQAYFRRLDALHVAGDLEEVTRLEEQLEGLCARPRTEATARVEIMTIHKAKGLEFDTVIVPGLERFMRGADRPLLRWTRVAGVADGLVLAPLTAAGSDTDPVYRWVELLEQQRSEHERARLLYVAATRAKRDLHLLGTVAVKAKTGAVELAAPNRTSMLSMLWQEVRPAFESAFNERSPQAELPIELRRSVPLKRLPLDWQAPAPGAAVQLPPITRVDQSGLEQPEFDWASETARHIGTLVHRELDRMSRQGATTGLRSARARLLAELSELGIPADRCELACDRVIAAIENTLADDRGRWIFGLDGRVRGAESELALSGVFHGEIIHRIIDRTFIDEHGVRWIVDFKTSTHEGGGLEVFLDAEVERYRPQLARYAHLMRAFRPGEQVRAALYFPVLKAWRVVGV